MKLKFLASVFFTLIFVFWPLTVASASEPGLKVEVYTYDPSALPDRVPYQLCESGWTSVQNIDTNFDAEYEGIVAGCQGDFVLVHYSGYLTSPESTLVTFQSIADDGFYMSLDGVPVIDDWYLKGCGGSSAVFAMTANQSYVFDAWFYEYGGGACNHLYWTVGDGMNVIPASAFTSEPVAPPLPPEPYLSAPFGLQAVEDDLGLNVSWSFMAEDTLVEFYTLVYTIDGVDFEVNTPSTSLILPDLPADTDITLKVRSNNASTATTSLFSDSIVFHTEAPVIVPPDPPKPPIIDPEPPVVVPKPPVVPEPPIVVPVEPQPEPEIPVIEPVSPAEAHQQLLDHLMEQAQADDIQVPEEVANIPVLGQTAVAVINAINFIGNVGADMSPTVREKAKKTLVAAVIVTQVAQLSTQTAIASSVSASTIKRK